MTAAPRAYTFVACVEAGPLEDMTVRLGESLRRRGGHLAEQPVIAVVPRFGPALHPDTSAALRRSGVTLLHRPDANPAPWFQFFNKPAAVALAESVAETPLLCWLDSDMLFLDAPDALPAGDPGWDFASCPDGAASGTTGPGHPAEPYWRAVVGLFGLHVDRLPWLYNAHDRVRVRMTWNGGLFAWRRSTGFARRYRDDCLRLLDARLAHPTAGVFFTEQIALTATVLRSGLRWRSLPESHNMHIGSDVDGCTEPELQEARILHYHDALWPGAWDRLLARLRRQRPETAEWLAAYGPLRPMRGLGRRLMGKALNCWRQAQRRAYEAGSRVPAVGDVLPPLPAAVDAGRHA